MKIWTKRTRETFWKQTTANSTTLREILVLSQVPMRFEADYLERGNIKVLICHVVSFPSINLRIKQAFRTYLHVSRLNLGITLETLNKFKLRYQKLMFALIL